MKDCIQEWVIILKNGIFPHFMSKMNRPSLSKGFTNIRFSCYFTGCCCMARDVPMSAPYFTTDGNTYKAQVGNSIQLLCQVENLGKYLIIEFTIKYV